MNSPMRKLRRSLLISGCSSSRNYSATNSIPFSFLQRILSCLPTKSTGQRIHSIISKVKRNMALKKEVLQKIATILKVKDTDLEAAIKDEKEVDITIDEKLQSFTEPELTVLKSNSYNDGKKAGVE